MKSADPLTRPCPVCMSPAGVPCSQATNTGRRTVKWFHLKREDRPVDDDELSDEDREERDDLWDWLGGDY